MAISTRVLGKLGGGGSEIVPFNISDQTNGNKYIDIATFTVPSGQTHLIAFSASMGGSSSIYRPEIHIADKAFSFPTNSTTFELGGAATFGPGTYQVRMWSRNQPYGTVGSWAEGVAVSTKI